GVLAHRRPHAVGKSGEVSAEFALDDLAVLARVHELDRVLEADYVEAARLVQVINHGGKRRRFAGAGRPGDEHHALVVIAKIADDRRHLQFLERRYFIRDVPKHRPDARVLAEQVDAEASAFLADI